MARIHLYAGLAALALMVGGFGASARATCIEFKETGAGVAMLINHCGSEMNVGYFVGPADRTINFGGELYRSSVPAEGTKVLWSKDEAPIPGRYQVRVFSCMAPTSLVFPRGGSPTCQVDFASEG